MKRKATAIYIYISTEIMTEDKKWRERGRKNERREQKEEKKEGLKEMRRM